MQKDSIGKITVYILLQWQLAFTIFCSNNLQLKFEEIHAPVSLEIKKTDADSIYEVSFYADNRETSFAGYRLYTAQSRPGAKELQVVEFRENRSFTPESGWCPSATPDFNQKVRIQLGGSSLVSGLLCLVNDVSIMSEHFLAVRAGVRRDCREIESADCFPWSEAALAQIP